MDLFVKTWKGLHLTLDDDQDSCLHGQGLLVSLRPGFGRWLGDPGPSVDVVGEVGGGPARDTLLIVLGGRLLFPWGWSLSPETGVPLVSWETLWSPCPVHPPVFLVWLTDLYGLDHVSFPCGIGPRTSVRTVFVTPCRPSHVENPSVRDLGTSLL